jgi:hydrogenase maturation factor
VKEEHEVISKFSLDVLKRCIHSFGRTYDTDVILGSAFGEDVALTRVGAYILVSHVDPIVVAIRNIDRLAARKSGRN